MKYEISGSIIYTKNKIEKEKKQIDNIIKKNESI